MDGLLLAADVLKVLAVNVLAELGQAWLAGRLLVVVGG